MEDEFSETLAPFVENPGATVIMVLVYLTSK